MAIVSRQDFADMCGDNVKTLNTYISRKKVIVHGDKGKLIDTEDMINMLYKKQRKERNNAKKEDTEIIRNIATGPKKINYDDDKEEDDDDQPTYDKNFISEVEKTSRSKSVTATGGSSPFLLKLQKDTELVSLRIEKEKILLDKAAGKLIPMDVAASLLKSQARSIFSNFDNAIENIAGIYCQIMANGDMSMYTRIVDEGKRALSVAIERAGADADNDLDTILTTFSEGNSSKIV